MKIDNFKTGLRQRVSKLGDKLAEANRAASKAAAKAAKLRERYDLARGLFESEYGALEKTVKNKVVKSVSRSISPSETAAFAVNPITGVTLKDTSLDILSGQTVPIRFKDLHKKVEQKQGRKIGLNNLWMVLKKLKDKGQFVENLDRGLYQLKK